MSREPADPTVLDTTVLSNFAYIDRLDLLAVVPRVRTVPEVRRELRSGADSYPHLQAAIDDIGEAIPVVEGDEDVQAKTVDLQPRLDPGEAQAFAVADTHDGTLVTDDGPARTFARENDVPVTGSIGVLVRAVEADRASESEADGWLKRWVDETDFRAPSREFSDYR